MDSHELRKTFLCFFEERGHVIVPSSSLIPDDPSVLFTTAGMQQFKPYYTGKADAEKHFGAKNTASVQKCFRTSDIDEVGDESHLTFFEMLGNFSFGGYFKKEAIQYAYDFFKELDLAIDYVSVFGGDDEVPADEESETIWQERGVKDIRRMGREHNFWGPTGSEGPCGPTTEIYINGVEIWNIVFNQYYCKTDKTLVPLETPGVDTGMGLERLAMVLQKKKNIFETDLFAPFMELLPQDVTIRHRHVIADHLRGAAFLLADGVRPSNKEAGYVLRRLMRRVLAYENLYKIQGHVFDAIMHDMVHQYGACYGELLRENNQIREEFSKERDRFGKTLDRGIVEMDKNINAMDEKLAFQLYETFGIPFEIIKEAGGLRGKELDRKRFNEEFAKHQKISRAGQEKKFGGHGLLLDTGELKAGNEEELNIVTRLHTATHLLNAALHKVLGDEVEQRGSDITAQRTRFDFSFSRRLTSEEISRIEELVNHAIKKDFPMTKKEMDLDDAKKTGALFMAKGHYPERVYVYTVGDGKEIFSRELCGGPHVSHTGEIGRFRIIREESSSAGVRRIRAIVA